MSNLNQIPQKIRNEFKVDSQGKTYCTGYALANLCGVSRSALYDKRGYGLFDKIAKANPSENSLPKSLKPLAGKDLVAVENYEIPDIVAAGIIEYFAFDSKHTNETAQNTYRAFASVGFRAWVQNELGYSEQNQTEMLNQILSELQELKETQKKYNSISDRVDDQQGLKEILADYEADKEALNSDYYTLRSWLDEKGIQLGNSALRKLANRVAHTYRTHYREAPRQVRAYKAGEEGKTNLVNVYRVSDEPLIRAAFKQCFR